MSKKGHMPERIFVAPSGHKNKEEHVYILFAVEEWDERGLPMRMRLIRNDEVINMGEAVASGISFMTAYVPTPALDYNEKRVNCKCPPLRRNTRKAVDE